MSIDLIIKLSKQRGFKDTFNILSKYKKFKVVKKKFNEELNKISYYNAFYRIKDDLVQMGMVNIEKNNGKKMVGLTEKGITVYKMLLEINKRGRL